MSEQDEAPRVVIRDRRKVDPESGAVRDLTEPVADVMPPVADPKVTELTADLQRLKAEYDNYRRRVERDRMAVVEQAMAGVLAHLLPVLDDVDRAREHGEVTGGFKSVADSLVSALDKLGVRRFGTVGDPFDPLVHEAVLHQHSPDVETSTCVEVLRPGYAIGERLLRPAMVAVADPPPEE